MGLLCPDAIPKFLNLFDLDIAPRLLFYTYIPAIVLSVLIGSYVLIKDRFSLASKLLFGISISFTLWVVNIFFAWIGAYADQVMLSWVVTPIFEYLIFALSIYFTYVFISNGKDISFKSKLILCLFALPIFIALPTSLNIQYFDFSICEGNPSPAWYYYLYALEIVSVFWVIFICAKKYEKLDKKNRDRKKIIYFMAGMASFLALFVGSNLIGQITLIQEISFIGSLGLVIFIAFLAYLIVQYKAFDIKLLGAQALVIAIIALIGSQFFLIKNLANNVLNAVTMALVAIFGWWLVNSVRKEVEAKEMLEQKVQERTKELGQSKKVAEERAVELEKWYKLTIGRELRMAELKEKIKETEEKNDQKTGF